MKRTRLFMQGTIGVFIAGGQMLMAAALDTNSLVLLPPSPPGLPLPTNQVVQVAGVKFLLPPPLPSASLSINANSGGKKKGLSLTLNTSLTGSTTLSLSPPLPGDGGGTPDTNNVPYVPAYQQTNGLWLEILDVTNGQTHLKLHNTTNGGIYALLLKQALGAGTWQPEQTVHASTNLDWTPLTVPVGTRTNNLFFWARTWNGLDENTNTLTDWWEFEHFGNFSQTATGDFDDDGINNFYELTYGWDPNNIAFDVSPTNEYVHASPAAVRVAVTHGVPGQVAILTDSTNFNSASWSPYTSSNLLAYVSPTEGWHDIWVGLKGRSPSSETSWTWTRVKLDFTPPALTLTSPLVSTTSVPVFQLTGSSPEALRSITYNVTNAAGVLTNEAAFLTARDYSTNTWEFTTNHFQGFDLALTNGLNTICLRATDQAGNVTVTNVLVTLNYAGDTTAPGLALHFPRPGNKLSGSSFTLRGLLNDPSASVTAKITGTNGVTNTVVGMIERSGLFWVDNLPLAAGTNQLTVIATDAASNSFTTNFSVVKSSVDLTVNLPSDEDLQRGGIPSLSGTVSAGDYAVWVNGVQAEVSGNNWTATAVPQNDGGSALLEVRAIPTSDNGGHGTTNSAFDLPTSANMANPTSSNAVTLTRDIEVPAYWEVISYVRHWAMEIAPNPGTEPCLPEAAHRRKVLHWSSRQPASGQSTESWFVGDHPVCNDARARTVDYTWPKDIWTSVQSPSVSGTLTNVCVHTDTSVENSSDVCGGAMVSMEHCTLKQAGHWWVEGADFGMFNVTRSAHASVRLHTGGRALTQGSQRNLFSLQFFGTVFPTAFWHEYYCGWSLLSCSSLSYVNNGGMEITDASRVTIMGKNLGTDGRLYQTLPNNAVVDITPEAPYKYYGYSLQPTKHRLVISANSHELSADAPGTSVGVNEHVSLGGDFVPAIPAVAQASTLWNLTATFANATAGTNPVIDASLLTNATTTAWWQNAGNKRALMSVNLTFTNGQYSTVAGRGWLTVTNP